ncbi:septum formation initiator family protein [Bacillus wiedmannii]|uniref:septum formation initiator family protein n=1 Tax=Bacillus wiedmannii TaxID=1890302 RepID=UPI0021D097F7|nr:septum formation initiator family protein [Bacillus wiedmannii]MCU5097034.1 septum formation initiator family protein [Bacillus wiedmannii]
MGSIAKLSQQQLNPKNYPQKDKKMRRRLLLAIAFMLPMIISVQISLYKQEQIIKEKQILLNNEKKKLSELEMLGRYFDNDIKTLTESEEGILKFARKLYGFSKPNETIFQIAE